MFHCCWLSLLTQHCVHLLNVANTHGRDKSGLNWYICKFQFLLRLSLNLKQSLRLLFRTDESFDWLGLLRSQTNAWNKLRLADDLFRTRWRSLVIRNIQLNWIWDTIRSVLKLELADSSWHHTATLETSLATYRNVSRIFWTHYRKARLLTAVTHLTNRWLFAVRDCCTLWVFGVKRVGGLVLGLLDYLAVGNLVLRKSDVFFRSVLCGDWLLNFQKKPRSLLQVVTERVMAVLRFYGDVVETLLALSVV